MATRHNVRKEPPLSCLLQQVNRWQGLSQNLAKINKNQDMSRFKKILLRMLT